jgi:hypothetical protein
VRYVSRGKKSYRTHDKFVSMSFKLGISPDDSQDVHEPEPLVLNHQVGSRPLIILQKMHLSVRKKSNQLWFFTPGIVLSNTSSHLVAEAMFDNGKEVEIAEKLC